MDQQQKRRRSSIGSASSERSASQQTTQQQPVSSSGIGPGTPLKLNGVKDLDVLANFVTGSNKTEGISDPENSDLPIGDENFKEEEEDYEGEFVRDDSKPLFSDQATLLPPETCFLRVPDFLLPSLAQSPHKKVR